ncbi:MAG: FtsW/RodA/SpoVE family cell cycle protein, partial [Gemmatimonadaceae bacterium]|nr:FtsW/RodA/SpoVE family cell cycle protein [Chitinophagaceae bacterium]
MKERNVLSHMQTSKDKWLLLFSAAAILMILFSQLYNELSPTLKQSEFALQSRQSLVLKPGTSASDLRTLFRYYYSDQKDAELAADSLASALNSQPEIANLGSINKKSFSVSAPLAWKSTIGGEDFQRRLIDSRMRLGFDSILYSRELQGIRRLPPAVPAGSGELSVKGKVMKDGLPLSNTLVQLQEHIASAEEDTLAEKIYYAHSNEKGEFSFTGLTKDSGYSVLPLKPGYEFGARKGTDALKGDQEYSFTASPHKIRLISPEIYSRLKEDGALIVRTPEDFQQLYWVVVTSFLIAFFVAAIFLHWKKIDSDAFILPVIMLLSGISILMLFSIQNPLADTMHAAQALQGVLIGLAGYLLMASLHIGKFYTKWWFDPLFNFKKRNGYALKGWTWLALAIVLGLITFVFGSGPEGSGVKVNLQIGGFVFQPSEITKYLMILFFAGFFAANEEKIRNLSDMRWRFTTSWTVMAGSAAVLMLYLLMGDMGPALVVCCSFLVFYSIARGNLLLMILSAALYCILLQFLPGMTATIVSFAVVIGILAWQGQLKSGKWYGAFAAL